MELKCWLLMMDKSITLTPLNEYLKSIILQNRSFFPLFEKETIQEMSG
jgi:hypothetical protein